MKPRNLFLVSAVVSLIYVIGIIIRGYGFDYTFDMALFGLFFSPIAWYFCKRIENKKIAGKSK